MAAQQSPPPELSAAPDLPSGTPAFSPLYQQIKGLILQSLEAGEWKPGEAIPSEMELAARFRVSQGTVRKAIDELAAENLVVRRQGKGTFVATHAEHHVRYRFLKLMPDSGDRDAEGPATRTILECKRVRASADRGHPSVSKGGLELIFRTPPHAVHLVHHQHAETSHARAAPRAPSLNGR